MVDFQCKERYDYEDLLRVMALLRSPGGCPWDREQDHASIRRNFLEETCEAVEAIDRGDMSALCEELGDVMMQVVFHARIEEEQGGFTMADVIDGVCKKLVYRHPHVFGGSMQADTSDQVLVNWEALKRKEKHQQSTADAVDAVARTLPGLWRAEKMQSKAAKAGFRWPSEEGALDKLTEEVGELREAVESGRPAGAPHGVAEEVGDVLFMAAKVARDHGIDPEEALHHSCDKFARRFRGVEEGAEGTPLSQLSSQELLALWDRSKQAES